MTLPDDLSAPYSYTFKLEEPTGLEFLVAMSDSKGFGTGGTTSVLTVGSSSDSSCLPSSLNYDFFFSLNPDSNPASCSSMSVSWPDNATEPVNLYGLIPHGSAWQIPIDQSANSYDWQVDIQSETRFLLFMSDNGPYQTGGSSPLYQVQSGETGCINDSPPKIASGGEAMTWATTASSHAPSASVSGVGGTSSGGASENTSSSHTGAIVGGTVGGVAFLVLLAILLFFCIKRRARNRSERDSDPGLKSYGIASGAEKGRRSNQLDLVDGNDDAERGGRLSGDESPDAGRQVEMNGDVYEPSPFRYPSPPETPGAGAAALAAGAGMGGRNGNGYANRASTIPPSLLNTPEMLAMAEEKGARTPTSPTATFSNYNNNRSSGEAVAPPEPPASSGAPATEASNQATVGHHGGGFSGRHSSIRKTPSSQQVGGTPAGVGAAAASSGNGSEGTRFVQHEDAGEVV
ncbi:hypothetical protein I317_05932 [Kwoniella heveanensis CBS 569]|nr:hypothetical protein I317_05932 [Kwoniella heveanensis CBS 569]